MSDAKRVPLSQIRRTVKLWCAALERGYPATQIKGRNTSPSALRVVSDKLGLTPSNATRTISDRLNTAAALGLDVPEWSSPLGAMDESQIRLYYGVTEPALTTSPMQATTDRHTNGSPPPAGRDSLDVLGAKIVGLVRRKPLSMVELFAKLSCDNVRDVDAGIAAAQAAGANLIVRNGLVHLDAAPALGTQRDDMLALVSDKDGWIRFGASGDQHLCSKYERLDCLNDYYDALVERGIDTVLNTGNWIDGEAPFNRHDLLVHGLDNQMQYLAKNYPQRPGMRTIAITGEDHEGWYARREGVDVGRYAANVMRQNQRTDWVDAGFMESFIRLVHRESGKHAMLSLMHPGGGSAYAISYAPQKIVEGFDGGDKPAVLLIGHYHKASYQLTRNVHAIQTGCFQDQTPFMRQKKLSAHLGGAIVGVHIDPRTGAVDECQYAFRNYFVKDYYNGRWSKHGPAHLAGRAAK